MDDYSRRSTAELIADVADDLRLLVRKEIELARLEVTRSLRSLAKGAGIIAVAALLALPGIVFLLVALALWLPFGSAAGFAIVGGGMVLLPAIGIPVGIRLIKRTKAPTQAVDSVKEDVRWARSRLTR